MDSRRFRRNRSAEILDRVRWLGWVMLMMFVLTQIASGTTACVGNAQARLPHRAWADTGTDMTSGRFHYGVAHRSQQW